MPGVLLVRNIGLGSGNEKKGEAKRFDVVGIRFKTKPEMCVEAIKSTPDSHASYLSPPLKLLSKCVGLLSDISSRPDCKNLLEENIFRN